MSLKQKIENLTPIHPDESERLAKIIRSVEALAIPPEIMRELRLVGSAALTAYGVEIGREPSDVDFAAPTSAMEALYHLGIAGEDTDYAGNRFMILKAEPEDTELAIQFIGASVEHASDHHDKKFRRYHRDSPTIPGTNIRVASPKALHRHLKSEALLDQKYKLDLLAFKQEAEMADTRRSIPRQEPTRSEARQSDSVATPDEPEAFQQDKRSA